MKRSLFLIVACMVLCLELSRATLLRSGTATQDIPKVQEERRLFLDGINIDQIIQTFLPILAAVIQATLVSNLENVDLDMNLRQDLANLDLSPNCTAAGTMDYHLGTLSGLDGFQIDSVQLVPGSDNLDISFLGLNGASWSGIWDVQGSFSNDIEVGSDATLSADACGVPFQEVSAGRVAASNPGLNFRLALDGESPSIFGLASSIADSIAIEDARFTFDNILPIIDGLFGDGGLELDLSTILSAILEGLFTDTLLNQLLPLILDLLQNALDGGLPF